MPNCCAFLKDGERQSQLQIDKDVCEFLGESCDDKVYHPAFNAIRLSVACGSKLPEIVADEERHPEVRKVAQWLLDQGYETNSWYQHGW